MYASLTLGNQTNLVTDIYHSFHEQPFLRELQQLSMRIDVSKTIKNTSVNLLDAFVDHMFEFVDHPLLPSQVPLTATCAPF